MPKKKHHQKPESQLKVARARINFLFDAAKEHFKEVFEKTKASGALAASIFHFGEIPIPELKEYLKSNKIAIR